MNSLLDEVDNTPGNGVVDTASGNITLRAAIMEANALAGADTITLGAGTHVLSIAGGFEDGSATGDLDISDDLEIVGAGAASTTVDAAQLDRVFHVLADGTAEISGLTITGGVAIGNPTPGSVSGWEGGGIRNDGTLMLRDSVVTGNTAITPDPRSTDGGGISSSGHLTVLRVTVSNNRALDHGGGISVATANSHALIIESTFIGNTARQGGGISNRVQGDLCITNCTFSGNNAIQGGTNHSRRRRHSQFTRRPNACDQRHDGQ